MASLLCLALELVRELHFGLPGLRFLLWNLFLAWIPLLLALATYDGERRGRPLRSLLLPGLGWLLFLPNAPYIVTDFVHLAPRPPAPLWFDATMLASFAATGVLLGFISLYLVQAAVQRRLGAGAGWATALGALALGSAGIYLGRVGRWNSWDLILEPGSRLSELATRLLNPVGLSRAAAIVAVLAALQALTYAGFYALIGLRSEGR